MRRLIAVTFLLTLLAAIPAQADETITATTPNRFSQSVTTIDQGEKVTLRNLDIAGHDVTSKERGLFASELIGPGQSGPVVGTEYLTTGTYPFVCSVHPGMEATLEVTSAGQPAARPEIKVQITSSDLQKVVKQRKLMVRVRVSEPSVVKVTAALGKTRLGAGEETIEKAGSKTVAVKLSKKGRKALAGRKKAKVSVTATGSGRSASTSRTLR